MNNLRKGVALYYWMVSVLCSILMSAVLVNYDNPTLVIGTSLGPYIVFMTYFGWLFSKWYMPGHGGPGLLEILGVPIVAVSVSVIVAGAIFGISNFLLSLSDSERLFRFEPSIESFIQEVSSGVAAGFVFLLYTALVQFPLLLAGGWWFCRKGRQI